MEYSKASPDDIQNIIEIFQASFYEDILISLGGIPPKDFFAAIFNLFLIAENEAFIIAREENKIAGFLFIPADMKRIWLEAVLGGHVFKIIYYLWSWSGFKYKSMLNLLRDKYLFLGSHKKVLKADAQVLTIAVAQHFRNQGIAKELLQNGINYLRSKKVKSVRLEVRPQNLSAKKVYEKIGFTYRGCTRDSFGFWLVMIMQLT